MKSFIIIFLLAVTVNTEAQNVGIGTVNPNYPLDINGRMRLRNNGATSGIWFNKADNTEAAFSGMFNDTITGFYGNNNWRIGIDVKNERLGIGNLAPTAPLSFAATLGKKISLYRGASGDAGFGVFGNELRINSDYSGADISFGYDNLTNGFTENMRIKGNGNVGIGTSTPDKPLTIKVSGMGISQESADGSSKVGFYTHSNAAYVQTHNNTNLNLSTNNASAQVTLQTGTGNFGIGQTNPSAKLDVAGTIKIADGTQGAGKVLTSDANGNASWQNAAYGNTERFLFRLIRNGTDAAVLTTLYNYGTASSTNGGSGININLPSAGLYHFDLNGNIFLESSYGPVLLYVSKNSNTQVISRTYGILNSSSGGSIGIDKSFDIYMESGGSITVDFRLDAGVIGYGYRSLTVMGHKIAD